MSAGRRIALFGGTFDPIHLGHLAIARAARETLRLDEVRFLPCHTSPHKSGTLAAPAADRLAMVRLALHELPWATVDDFDLVRPQPAYSFETVEEMAAREPGANWFWLMGADQWRALPDWREPERLAARVKFIVFARDGRPEPQRGWRLHFLPGTHPASATAIRSAYARGETPPPWLTAEVAAYIARRGLYGTSPSGLSQ
jgi:nicotinate-nucleotide adenylyltransferase